METLKKTSMIIDFKQTTMIPMPQFIQQDTNVLEFEIKENGEAADLNNVGRIVVNYKRPDGKVISRLLTVEGNTATYTIGLEEMQVAGFAEIELQFYSKDNEQRISTKRFKVSMSQEIGTREIGDTKGTLTILQELFVEVETLIAGTEEAAQHANDEAEYARAKGNYAQEKAELAAAEASNLETLKTNVVSATNAANTAAADATTTAQEAATEAVNIAEAAATEAKQTADTAAGNADEKAALAQTQADYAKEQGDIAKQKQAELQGLSVVQYNDRLVKVESELSDSNRQSQNLQHGVQVINASADSLADFEIAGRTLIPMASTPLRGGMFYVLADKRTIIAIDGQRRQGVTKFQKSASLTTKATFAGKTPGSTANNPHAAYGFQAGHSLMTPTSLGYEIGNYSGGYGAMATLDGTGYLEEQQETGAIPQMVYVMDLVAQVERNLGRITATNKVQWLKDNASQLSFSFNGYGKGPSGNLVYLKAYDISAGAWMNTTGHTSAAVSKLTIGTDSPANYIDANGKAYFIAYGEAASDSTRGSVFTDFVELDLTLKAGAQLDTRPQIIRIANFQDKVSGSTVENPHVFRYFNGFTELKKPGDSGQTEYGQVYIDKIKTLDGTSQTFGLTGSGYIAQHLFSFNLIEEIERNVGKIPKSTVADKVQWLKDNLAKVTCNWHGFGSGPGGNKANLALWRNTGNYDANVPNHTSSTVKAIGYATSYVSATVDSNGFVHFLAYADASDGQTPSTINTDYVELEIELKPGADIHHPVVPLYEVTQAEYDNILVAWDEMAVLSRYPKVQGMQHLQNPAVIVEGENLLPPFYEWNINTNAKVLGPYELSISTQSDNTYIFNSLPNTTYSISFDSTTIYRIDEKDVNGTSTVLVYGSTAKTSTFTTKATSKVVTINFYGTGTIKSPMLTLGSTAKPFVPRNPSYLFAQVKLGQIGDKKDILFRQDGNWMVRKEIEKDVVLDGILGWDLNSSSPGYKQVNAFLSGIPLYATILATKHNGSQLRNFTNGAPTGAEQIWSSADKPRTTISNIDSGWADAMNPTADDIKRYFNGWKYQDGTIWISVTGNGQTATAATALTTKPTDYVPYKLSYVLQTPQMVNVTDKVEGDIAVNGPTVVEITSGVVVREKVTLSPLVDSGVTYQIANMITKPETVFKNKTNNILGVYKNQVLEKRAQTRQSTQVYNGGMGFRIPQSDFDPTAEYTVTYLVLDRHLFTVNATEVKAFLEKSLKSVVDKLVEKEADNATLLSVHARTIYEMLVRIKRLEG